MTDETVVPAYPYEGAFYWFLAAVKPIPRRTHTIASYMVQTRPRLALDSIRSPSQATLTGSAECPVAARIITDRNRTAPILVL